MGEGVTRGTIQTGSLVSKLLSLRIGETIYLDDRKEPGKATLTERATRNVIAKSPALTGMTFATERWIAVQSNPVTAKAILAVRRMA